MQRYLNNSETVWVAIMYTSRRAVLEVLVPGALGQNCFDREEAMYNTMEGGGVTADTPCWTHLAALPERSTIFLCKRVGIT